MFGKREAEHYDYPILSIYNDIIQPNIYNQLMQNIEILQNQSIFYIHIPFCASQCIFCNYYKITKFDMTVIENYFLSLEKEVKYYASQLRDHVKIIGVHFGGGTPSVVPVKHYALLLEVIRNQFCFDDAAIVSFEGNINSLSKKNYIKQLKSIGINRISFGIQTFNQEIRNRYGLKGNFETIVNLCDTLQNEGIKNYNADIMFNFPEQNVSEVYGNVLDAFELGIQTIDLYSLLIYPETKMYYLLKKNNIWKEYSDREKINGYEHLYKKLANDTSYAFTMSNTIAKKNTEENIILSTQLGNNHCNSGNIIGIGASSRGYISGLKYKNYVDINEYMVSVEKYSFGVQLGRKLTNLEINTRWLVMAPNFMCIDISSGFIDEERKKLLDLMIKKHVLSYKQSKYIFNKGMNFWAGNVSALLMNHHETFQMKNTVLKNRKNHLNMYNQDKMQIIEGENF
ncbi:MAG: radical SAM protein [Lachnospiraceae bacterium]|nr:radical SAM protein [Lachnospiraceae bacterium]